MLERDNEEEIEMILSKTIKQKNRDAPSPLKHIFSCINAKITLRYTYAIVNILRSDKSGYGLMLHHISRYISVRPGQA